jgi:hypothetical protein
MTNSQYGQQNVIPKMKDMFFARGIMLNKKPRLELNARK